MAAFIQQLQALLEGIGVAGGVHAQVNRSAGIVYPYLTWTRVASQRNVTLDGPSDLQPQLVQVDAFGRTMLEADTVARLVANAFATWSVANAPQTAQDFYEEAVQAHRVMQDFLCWSRD